VSSIPGRKQRLAALALKMSVSLDGFVAPVDGSTGWIAAGGSDDALSWTVETIGNAFRLITQAIGSDVLSRARTRP
jgi:hypothetical protein